MNEERYSISQKAWNSKRGFRQMGKNQWKLASFFSKFARAWWLIYSSQIPLQHLFYWILTISWCFFHTFSQEGLSVGREVLPPRLPCIDRHEGRASSNVSIFFMIIINSGLDWKQISKWFVFCVFCVCYLIEKVAQVNFLTYATCFL